MTPRPLVLPRCTPAPPLRALALSLCSLALACTVQDPVAVRVCSGDLGCAAGRSAYCAGHGPPLLGDGSAGAATVCSGTLAAQTFARALCTCADYTSDQPLKTDSFDSGAGAYAPGGKLGGAGINGKIETRGMIQVGGTLWASGAQGIHSNTTLTVTGDLHDGGPLGGPGTSARVDGDAEAGGDIQLTDLHVGGTLSLPAAAALTVSGQQRIGALRRASVSVPPPCSCAAAQLLGVEAYVAAYRTGNDNADLGFDPQLLDGFQSDLALDLPCGRFYLPRLHGSGGLTLRAGGRTALFVEQGITLSGSFRVAVAPGGEFDLFVAGPVNTGGLVELGAVDAPALVRLYIGGAGALNLSAPGQLGGELYAPERDLALSGGAELFGAVFVRNVLPTGPLTIHYDTRVLKPADGCPGA